MRRVLARAATTLGAVLATALVGILAMRALAPDPCHGRVLEVAERPTIIVVMFDDLDVTLAEAMPTWTDVASRGVTFTRSFVTTPLCCPSRATFLTGQYARTHGVVSNRPPNGGYQRALELGIQGCSLPVWLDRAGYDTAMIGRFLNGHAPFTSRATPPGWDDWQALHGGKYTSYRLNDNGTLVRPDTYATDELAERAVRAVSADRERPLFLVVNATAPHEPVQPASRHADDPAPDGVDPGRYRLMLAGMELLDRVLLDTPDDAYVVITSDNGFHTVPTWGKSLPWDSDTRVPLVVIGPGIESGERSELVANVDLAPTIAEWAGVEPPPSVEGRSLMPVLRSERAPWRASLDLELPGVWRAVRTAHDLTVTWADGRVERREDGDPPGN